MSIMANVTVQDRPLIEVGVNVAVYVLGRLLSEAILNCQGAVGKKEQNLILNKKDKGHNCPITNLL